MNLTDPQRQQVTQWLEAGLKLADLQKRLETELGLRLTYMEVKLLVSELKVLPRDAEPTPATPLTQGPAHAPKAASAGPGSSPGQRPPPLDLTPVDDSQTLPAGTGRVQVTVDHLARPGTMVSGGVTFGDGKTALWYIDQMGRVGMAPKEKGYRPSAADMQDFQMALDQELTRLGL